MNAQFQANAIDPARSALMRVSVTLAALGAVWLLTTIPAPGIDATALGASGGFWPLTSASVSIVALAFNTVASALVVFELLRLALPGMMRWATDDGAQSAAITRAMLALALLLALFQSWGVASALEEIESPARIVPSGGDAFRLGFALTQLAGTAVLVMLADTITRLGTGSGFWVMIAAFQLAAVPAALLGFATTPGELLPLLAVCAVASALLYAVFQHGIRVGRSPRQSAADLILPAFLGPAAANVLYAMSLLPRVLFSGNGFNLDANSNDAALRLALNIIAIGTVAFVRLRGNSARALQISTLQVALLLSFDWLASQLGVRLLTPLAMTIAVIASLLAWTELKQR